MIVMGTKIGLISDTHIPTRARELPAQLFEIFGDVDHIIHAGDYVDHSVISNLQKIAPITGCYGNMDPTSLKNELLKVVTLKIENHIIKIIHNLGGGARIKEFKSAGATIIIHGHTHKVSIKREPSLLIINPGSATNSFITSNSVGLLYLTEDSAECEIVQLK